jgi:hypothetical protein
MTTTSDTPAVFRLSFELLTAVFEQLPRRADGAAASRTCRWWAHVGSAVLWRCPPKCLLLQLPVADLRMRAATYIAKLSLTRRSMGHLWTISLPTPDGAARVAGACAAEPSPL